MNEGKTGPVVKRRGVSILVFLAEGTPGGLRVVERSNWTGVVLMAPVAEPEVLLARPELAGPGTYLLVGSASEVRRPLYVGEADDVAKRLRQHLAKADEQWQHIVVATRKDTAMNKAHVRWLERELIALGQAANRSLMVNKQSGFNSTLHEADIATMESYLEDLLTVLPLLGIDAFDVPQQQAAAAAAGEEALTCTGPSGVAATGYEKGAALVVTGGTARAEAVASAPPATVQLRQQLRDSGVLTDAGTGIWAIAQPFTFDSPSAAASAVLGRPANGLIEWKTANGRTLKTLREQRAGTIGSS